MFKVHLIVIIHLHCQDRLSPFPDSYVFRIYHIPFSVLMYMLQNSLLDLLSSTLSSLHIQTESAVQILWYEWTVSLQFGENWCMSNSSSFPEANIQEYSVSSHSTTPELKVGRLFWWPLACDNNKQVHSVCGPASSGLPLHQSHCASSHANVVQKRYLALKTWQAVKKGAAFSVWSSKCDRRLQEKDPRLAA